MFTQDTSLIIPTRNRNSSLLSVLSQLKKYKIKFKEILIIDSSDKIDEISNKKICKNFSVKFLYSKPSISFQRNYGLKERNKKTEFVMFLDDDIFFHKNSFLNMNKIINIYKDNNKISGFGFNLISNRKKNFFDYIKSSYLVSILKLYSNKPGVVTQSGWHTTISNLKKNILADWFSTQAVIYKCKFLKKIKFNEKFGIYSYLEDLDFSFRVNKNRKIFVSYLSKYKHPNEIKRNNIGFGIIEIFNRFIFVRNNNLNYFLFFLGSFIRLILSLINIFFQGIDSALRAFGNFIGLFKSFFYLLFSFIKK